MRDFGTVWRDGLGERLIVRLGSASYCYHSRQANVRQPRSTPFLPKRAVAVVVVVVVVVAAAVAVAAAAVVAAEVTEAVAVAVAPVAPVSPDLVVVVALLP